MTKAQRRRLEELKAELSQPKNRLLDVMRKIEEISPRQAEQLGRIIGRLEHFQNS